jgi:hypothetical protein
VSAFQGKAQLDGRDWHVCYDPFETSANCAMSSA